MSDFQSPSATPAQDFKKMVEDMGAFWQAMAENAAHIAASRRTLFLAYVAEGFTEAQALELVKNA